ncbi:MAG: DUF4197 domain-containing protein [Bacteroidales bacterium]|nr:DUF4197 domain-containing protein [Bacteroidales bacterium]
MQNSTFSTKLSKNLRVLLVISLVTFGFQSCDEDGNLLLPPLGLTEAEVAQGLREALKVGTNNSVEETNRLDGYFGNPDIKIPWPQDAMGAYNYINNNMGFIRPLLDEVVLLMNRGAEAASDKAKPIFIDAITGITIHDAWEILNGADNSATMYLHSRTFSSLHEAFKPDIHNALQTVGAAALWTQIANAYNPVATISPGLNPLDPDLAGYATEKALDGLFFLIAEEEYKIRTDPIARINDILRRVFGTLDN